MLDLQKVNLKTKQLGKGLELEQSLLDIAIGFPIYLVLQLEAKCADPDSTQDARLFGEVACMQAEKKHHNILRIRSHFDIGSHKTPPHKDKITINGDQEGCRLDLRPSPGVS